MRPDGPFQHSKHIMRAGLLLVVGLVALVLGRSLFVPETWGDYGSYRGANVAQQMAKPVMHGGNRSCQECHPDEFDTVTEGPHGPLACESCHAPLALHVADDDKVADMPVHPESGLCVRCHQSLDARPAGQPQVNAKQHVEEQEGEWSDTVCLDCHEAHEPL